MNRKFATVGGVLVIVAVAVVSWHACHGGGGAAPSSAGAKTVTGPAAVAGGGHGRIDPRTVDRASLGGIITDEDRVPVPHARVCADISTDQLSGELVRDPRCTNADDHGNYVLGNLYAAEYRVAAMAKPYRPAVYHPDGDLKRDLVELHAGEHRTGIDLVLRKGGVEITGTVADITGGPIAHAQVRARAGWWSGETYPAIDTDDDGKFSMWVRPGTIEVAAVADGYAEGTDGGKAPGRFEILLTPESSLAGTVIDAKTREPVSGVKVAVSEGEWGASDPNGGDITNEQGHFRVTRLSPGRYVAIARAEHGYGHSEGSSLVGLGQHVDGVVVKLYPAVRVAGKVVIPGSPKKSTCKLSSLNLHDKDHERWLSAVRDHDGALHYDGVLPGTYQVEAGCDGYRSRDKYPSLEVKDQDLVGLEWEVETGATIRGRVLTKTGTPVEDAQIWARTTGGDARAKVGWGGDKSARDGTYKLDGLKPGAYKLELDTNKGVGPLDGWKLDVGAGAVVEKDLVIDDAGTVKGTVVDVDGKPLGGVHVSAESLANGVWSWGGSGVRSNDDGSFTLESIRPGDYRIKASRGEWSDDLRKPGSNDDAKQGERVTVHASQTSSVRLVVESLSGTIKGTVTDVAGKPVSDAFVVAARESDAAGSQRSSISETRWSADDKPVLTSTTGGFTIGKLSPGSYALRAFRKGGGEAIAEHVPVGGTAKLQIKATGSIEGTVHRDGGAPVELDVELRDPKVELYRGEHFFRTDGHFAMHDLPGGSFTITVKTDSGQKQTTVDLAEGEQKTGVDIELDALITLTGRVVDLQARQPVPGITMVATLGKTGGGFSFSSDDEQDNVSDDSGRFTIKNAPRGQLTIRGFPKDWNDSPYGWITTTRDVDGTGTVDVGDVSIVKRRVKPGDPVGELGVHFADSPDGTPVDQNSFKVSWIDPAGPAAKTELKVGDVVTTIDGVDVTGANYSSGWMLLRAPPTTAIRLGLARGVTVTVVLAAP